MRESLFCIISLALEVHSPLRFLVMGSIAISSFTPDGNLISEEGSV